jgi:hypothetical protein
MYQSNPAADDTQIQNGVAILLGIEYIPTARTLATWRVEFREQGIPIPDRRQTK